MTLSVITRHSQNTRINKSISKSKSSLTETITNDIQRIQANMSSFNPFRSPANTPNPTGSTASPPAPASSNNDNRTFTPDDLEEPPPYTPTPAVYAGEATLEQGPSRPFQPPPTRPPQPQMTGSTSYSSHSPPPSTSQGRIGLGSSNTGGSILQQLSNSLNAVVHNLTNSPPPISHSQSYPNNNGVTPQHTGWSSYPGHQQQQAYRPTPPPTSTHSTGTPSHLPPPPPRHPSSSLPARSPTTSTSFSTPPRPNVSEQRTPSSDFARDFYAVGAADPSDQDLDRLPPLPPSPVTQTRPGVSGHGRTASSSSNGGGGIANDGKPTTHPVPGHPLLHEGKLLVYPKGHECEKCHNTGYKSYDPSRPCKKCWSKYAKPFSGPLVYSFSPAGSVNAGASATNFQRPLPQFLPPQHHRPPREREPSFFAPPPGASVRNNNNTQQQYAPPPVPPPAPPGGFFSGMGPNANMHHNSNYGANVVPVLARPGGGPPPNALVYTAGDPRIGGMLCWRCNGKGSVSILPGFGFLTGGEREMCGVCRGIGRTFE
ncbi:hypothetical protein CPC08DRAFT_707669 [Agrocybe pediades]|nr:hypothetical protein CPC08DRAFT_707669 [Agrocybe pediades]